jgi:hypothetical protein
MSRDALPTGSGTSAANDVADPHPSTEEHYDRIRRPGGANPPKKDLGPNPSIHNGKPEKRPRNAETE